MEQKLLFQRQKNCGLFRMDNPQSKIPKLTHRIWFQGWDKVPEKYHENVRLLEEMNPDFKHMKWDEQSLRRECESLGDEYVKKFDSFTLMILKIDFGRYVVLYKYGGISVDLDMKPMRPLKEIPGLETEQFIVGLRPFPESILNVVNNATIVTTPKHDIIGDLLNTCIKNTNKRDNYFDDTSYVQSITGPDVLNTILEKYSNYSKIGYEYFEPCYSIDLLCRPTEKTILDHQHSMSWINPWRILGSTILLLFLRLFPIIVLGIFVYFILKHTSLLKKVQMRKRIKNLFK